MKLFKYILISVLLHAAAFTAFTFRVNPAVSLGMRSGEISLSIGRGERGGRAVSHGDFTGKTGGEVAGKSSGPASDRGDAAGIPGVIGRLVSDAYRNNPPEYPAIARAMGYQGRVTLLLEVMPDGSCGTVDVTKSSGYRVLDLAALKAARGWIFFTDNSILLASPVRISQDIIFMLKTY